MGEGAVRGLQRHFQEMFHDQGMTAAEAVLIDRNIYIQALWQAKELPSDVDSWSEMLVGKTSFGSVDEAFGNMTSAMTAYIQTHGEEGLSHYAKGSMWSVTTCIYVRWEWIIFPVAMVTLTAILLVLVVTDNWGKDNERL